jgi:hypothetical protein
LSKLLSKCPFASAKNIMSHFDISVSTVRDLFARQLGVRKFTRRWVPHSLSDRQNDEWVIQSRLLLDLLRHHQTADFVQLQPETSRVSDRCIQLAPCMPNPGVKSLLASAVE